jgi:hypothetical protein
MRLRKNGRPVVAGTDRRLKAGGGLRVRAAGAKIEWFDGLVPVNNSVAWILRRSAIGKEHHQSQSSSAEEGGR